MTFADAVMIFAALVVFASLRPLQEATGHVRAAPTTAPTMAFQLTLTTDHAVMRAAMTNRPTAPKRRGQNPVYMVVLSSRPANDMLQPWHQIGS